MNQQAIVEALEGYVQELEGILSRFVEGSDDGLWIARDDDGRFKQIVHEVKDIFRDHITEGRRYSDQLTVYMNASIQNFFMSPSYQGVGDIKVFISSVLTRVKRSAMAVRVVAQAAHAAGNKDPEFIGRLAVRLPIVIRELRHRRQDRPTLDVNDEYDLQDLMRSLMAIHFDDIRPEEWTPSYAGSSSRMDFFLPEIEAVVETKMTRERLNDKRLGEELFIDIARYEKHPHCRTLYCIVYDPEQRIRNPRGLESDIERHSRTMTVRVMIVSR